MKKESLFTMKFMVISLLIILIPLSSALNFDFSYPKEVSVNETFSVSIDLESTKTFDVKIFVHQVNNKTIARSDILSNTLNKGKWQSSWFYISSAFPETKDYQINVNSQADNSEICVQLRESNKSSFTKICKQIIITSDSYSNNKTLKNKEDRPIIVNRSSIVEPKTSISSQQDDEIIFLTPRNIEISTRYGTLLKLIVYLSFFISAIILIILLANL